MWKYDISMQTLPLQPKMAEGGRRKAEGGRLKVEG